MEWVKEIPAKLDDGRVRLVPKNDEPKLVKDVAQDVKDSFQYIVDNDFPGVFT